MDVLLTFTGFHDPYFKGLIAQEEQLGPILSLLTVRSFDHIFLFDTPSTRKTTQETKVAISKLQPHAEVQVLEVELEDPTNYEDIFKGLRAHLRNIVEKSKSASFFIAVASGTPQMHACWVLMTASGEIPARILHVRPHRFVTKEHPLVSEIDLSSHEFPTVRFQSGTISVEESEVDGDTARLQLGIVGDHPAMKRVLETGAMLAPSRSPILIFGEIGTGKELFARFIHKLSGRGRDLFVAVNCAAVRVLLILLRPILERLAPQVAQKNINLRILRELPVPVPHRSLQDEFVVQHERLLAINEVQIKSLHCLERLWSILLHSAYNGNLTARWREAHMRELLAEMHLQSRYLDAMEVKT